MKSGKKWKTEDMRENWTTYHILMSYTFFSLILMPVM